MNIFSLQGKKTLVTGGGSGIGFGIAKIFIKAGAEVLIVGRNEDKLKDAKAELGEKCTYISFDVSNLDEIPDFVDNLETNWGALDVLVNCAGTHLKKSAVETTDSDFLSVLNVHLMSVFALTREFAKRMIERKQGSIILISSMTAVMGMKQVVAYSTAKTAVVGLMRSLVAELAVDNVRVNTIAPGWIETPMLHKAIDHDLPRKTKILARIPAENFGQPDDIGYAALYLASDASKYVNGVFLPIDGGAAGGF
ncbi:3-oxoacyl-ACP reductase [Seonamhaeicola sp. S2-3]|uniref:SDR family NAD(P)-dependent oxidoreductase n=1 Tax=Seonamhaeicola sp. S2-3 TaxID=1936081 RepID=UPI000972BBB4|nr:SDR family oxidoreductase [Seonamhaeicola sp. S2-3]APY11619.1 3-oxoacyl-ACP reductase [Seonamhaeicola sp. S2-3]